MEEKEDISCNNFNKSCLNKDQAINRNCGNAQCHDFKQVVPVGGCGCNNCGPGFCGRYNHCGRRHNNCGLGCGSNICATGCKCNTFGTGCGVGCGVNTCGLGYGIGVRPCASVGCTDNCGTGLGLLKTTCTNDALYGGLYNGN